MADSVTIIVSSLEERASVSAQVTATPDTVTPEIQEYIGTNGLSAYELWINEGNNGTVADFLLSLKGSDGDQGPAGAKGDQGERGLQGLKGDDGYTPVKGVDYNDGADGLAGSDGAPGADGKEVEFQKTATHIQWRYVNESWSNLVALTDIKGADGVNGSNGLNGDDGADGVGISGIALQNTDGLNKTYRVTFTNSSTFDFTVIDGATGSQGIKGDKGEKGDTGSAGSQGIQGIQGPAGANGSDASVTKENVENVLTGNINSHSHYDSIVYSIIL